MKNHPAAYSIFLASLALLTACRNEASIPLETSPVSVQESTETTEEAPSYEPQLPEKDYAGEKFTILYRYGSHAYNVTDIWVENMNGEAINDTVYNRNLAFEEKFGVMLDPRPDASPVAAAKKEILADSVAFDLCGDRMYEMFPLCTEGYFYDWNRLLYVNPDDPWWDSNAARELSIGGQLPMTFIANAGVRELLEDAVTTGNLASSYEKNQKKISASLDKLKNTLS